MSQRSQMAMSGSRPIAACSAACAAPGTCAAVIAARSRTSCGTAHHSAFVVSSCGGSASGTVSTVSPVASSFLTNPVTCRATRTVPKNAGVSRAASRSSSSTTSMSVTSRDCV